MFCHPMRMSCKSLVQVLTQLEHTNWNYEKNGYYDWNFLLHNWNNEKRENSVHHRHHRQSDVTCVICVLQSV